MAAKIKASYPGAEVELIGGGKGDFIVKADQRELWNKKQMGNEFPEEATILEKLGS